MLDHLQTPSLTLKMLPKVLYRCFDVVVVYPSLSVCETQPCAPTVRNSFTDESQEADAEATKPRVLTVISKQTLGGKARGIEFTPLLRYNYV